MGNGENVKTKGWFSKRHQSNQPHFDAVNVFQNRSGIKSRRMEALDNLFESRRRWESVANRSFGNEDNFVDKSKKQIERINKEIATVQTRLGSPVAL